MSTPAQLAKKILTSRYREIYGKEFSGFSPEYAPDSQYPTWVWLDKQLNPSVEAEHDASLILDPEIGICLYLLPFSTERGVQSQIFHTLKIRSRLLPIRDLAHKKRDLNGSWRVIVHWFVDAKDSEAWVKEVGELRGETAHFEEIPIDAIVNKTGNWEYHISEYVFPRLLFKTRYVLKKKSKSEVDNWSSADLLVERTVKKFPEHFKSDQLKKYASEVTSYFERLMEEREGEHKPDNAIQAETLNTLGIRNFRNIDELNFSFDDKGRGVGAWLIHGPNGTGKSSVYEALSFALCGTSYRYEQYLADKNETVRDRFDKYLHQYLRPLGEMVAEPSIVVDGEEVSIEERSINSDSDGSLQTISGTMLSQEQSSEFVRMKGSELGAQIVGQASFLANEIRAYVERRYSSAREEQKIFFDRWGLNKNIKNVETAKRRITEKFVADKLYGPEQVIAWLDSPVMKMFSSLEIAASLADIWARWRGECQKIVKDIAKLKTDNLKDRLLDALKSRNDLALKTESYLNDIERMSTAWDYQLESDLKSWGEWLEKQSEAQDIDNLEIKSIREKQQELQKRQQEVSAQGQLLSGRVEHLDAVQKFITDSQWTETHGDECPTCSTDLTDRNGLAAVIMAVHTESTAKVEEKRQVYRQVTSELKNIEERLADLGAAPPPISTDRQAALIEMTQWIFPPGEGDLRGALMVADKREPLLSIVAHLRQMPRGTFVQSEDSLESIAEEMAVELDEAFARAGIASAEENAWREIQSTLTGMLSALVDKHLPETLQALWVELSLNLTSARWQLPGGFAFTVDTKRNQPVANVSLDVGDFGTRLARYILNEAEVHVLGLAWFFVRHLTNGRFYYNYLVMDDPAQEMDQPTYRELCRLWETFLRLHLRYEIPFKLITLLHQDERALDAARATGGTLHFLRWNAGKTEIRRSTRLLGETYFSPHPTSALELKVDVADIDTEN